MEFEIKGGWLRCGDVAVQLSKITSVQTTTTTTATGPASTYTTTLTTVHGDRVLLDVEFEKLVTELSDAKTKEIRGLVEQVQAIMAMWGFYEGGADA